MLIDVMQIGVFMQLKRNKWLVVGALIAGVMLLWGIYWWSTTSQRANGSATSVIPVAAAPASAGVTLTDAQLKFVTIQPVGNYLFANECEAVGTIDFNEDMTVQVSSPYPGRIVTVFAKSGDAVRKGQILFTVASPDLLQAESTLLSSSGVLTLTSSVLSRAKALYAAQGLAQKDYQQAISDQQAAEAAYKAARDAVRIFGKSDAEIDRVVKQHVLDSTMPVSSPVNGQVTARNAAPGGLVQPGGSPAPYTVSNLSSKWMLANVTETDLPLMRIGAAVDVKLMAYPGRVYHGKIDNIAEALDPNTHRATVRAEIRDPNNEMQPQMFATFTVHTGNPISSLAVPDNGVVREGDGTMTVWVTQDKQHFIPRTVQIGLQQHGQIQILSGLNSGELIVSNGALFISNARNLDEK